MNEARMYADGFETMFAKQEDFMAIFKADRPRIFLGQKKVKGSAVDRF